MSITFLFGNFRFCGNARCGKAFEPQGNRRGYCSNQCRTRGRGAVGESRICDNELCGKSFVSQGNQKRYCSIRCGALTSMKEWRSKSRQVFPEKPCDLCGDPFTPTRSWQRFCCRDCMILHQNTYGRGDRRKVVFTPEGGVKRDDGSPLEAPTEREERRPRLDGDRADRPAA